MTNYRRSKVRGAWYFFTVVTHQRRRFLTDDSARKILKESIQTVKLNHPFLTSVFCLLPDHLHCIWKMPEDDCDYSLRWSLIKRAFSKKYTAAGGKELPRSNSRTKKREAGIWQRRFWEHRIRCEDDYWNHVHYIHQNPVKHKLVKSPEDWPYSTYHGFAQKGIYKDFDWNIFQTDNFNTQMQEYE